MGLGRRTSIAVLLVAFGSAAIAQKPAWAASPHAKAPREAKLDRSGKARKGTASYYGKKFRGKKMADGTAMKAQSDAAASKTLPLGTKAKVTNLETGKSAVVEVKDRGPYVKGRIIDVSPKTAEKLDIKEKGVAPVEVKPIELPQRESAPKSGAGAADQDKSKP